MDIKEILGRVDHTRLDPAASWDEIRKTCDEGMHYGTASVCIPPSYVQRVKEYTAGRIEICTVIGFPNGYQTENTKKFEAREALLHGAGEIDMVINLGDVKNRAYEKIEQEIRHIKEICGSSILKVIVETCLLTEEEKIRMCRVVTAAEADYIKTSTGFAGAGAAFDDISLFKQHVGSQVRIKAAGGIHSIEDAKSFLSLGADRLGTSRIVALVQEMDA